METKEKVYSVAIAKDTIKEDVPMHCDIHLNVTEHEVTFKSFEYRSQLIVIDKLCILCRQKAIFKYSTPVEPKTAFLDVHEFLALWNQDW